MTSGNRIITLCFGLITISQFGLGIYVVSDAVEKGCESVTKCAQSPAYLTVSALQILPIPLPGYIVCTFNAKVPLQIGFIAMSLAYGTEFLLLLDHREDTRSDHLPDLLAFSVIICIVVRSGMRGVPIPSIFKTITRDAVYYFLVIFTAHLLLVIFLALARVSTTS